MKKFIAKILLFGLLIYVLAWGFDYIISKGQTKISGYPQQTWQEIKTHSFDCDGVIMGTSRGLEHYDPMIIDSITGYSFYNLGMGGYNINAQLMKYRYYTQHNPKPEFLIYDVDYILMHISAAVHQHQSEQFLPLIYDYGMCKELQDVGYSIYDVYFPLVRWWGYQTHIKRGIFDFFNIKHHTEYPSYKGHTPDPDNWDLSRLEFKDSIASELEPEAKQLFETYLNQLQNEGTKVALINSPKYYKMLQLMMCRNEEFAYFDSISKTYNIPYLDYTQDYWICKDSSLFNAGVHLTPTGTKIFSKKVADDLVKIGFFEK